MIIRFVLLCRPILLLNQLMDVRWRLSLRFSLRLHMGGRRLEVFLLLLPSLLLHSHARVLLIRIPLHHRRLLMLQADVLHGWLGCHSS